MPHYANARRIDAHGYQVFGEDLTNPIASTAGYAHNLTEWPGTVYDFSGCPLARSQASVLPVSWTGALITPRHILTAYHVLADWTVGDEVYFVNPAGTLVTREVIAKSTGSGGFSDLGNDLALITLDSAVTGCAVYKIPTVASVSTNDNPSSLVGTNIWCLDRPHTINSRRVRTTAAFIDHESDGSGGLLVDGDSGQPAFITVGTELVLLGTHSSSGSMPNAAFRLSQLQAFCDTVGETIQTISVDPADWAEPLAAQLQDATA